MKKSALVLLIFIFGLFAQGGKFVLAAEKTDIPTDNTSDSFDGVDPTIDEQIIDATENIDTQSQSSDGSLPVQNENGTALSEDQRSILQIIPITNVQSQLQEKIVAGLRQPEAHSQFIALLIGPDFADIKKIKNDVAAKQQKTQEMQQLIEKIQDLEMKNALGQQLDKIKQEDADYQRQLALRGQGFSLLGWFVGMFY